MKGFGKKENSKSNKELIQKDIAYKQKIIDQAFLAHSQGDLLEAAKNYQLFIEKGFKDPRVFTNYGVILEESGQIEKAINLYKKSIKFFPKNSSDAYSNLGGLLKDVGNLKDAERYTKKAILLCPDFAEAYSNLGDILKRQGLLKDAEKATRKALKLNPNFADAYCNLGGILRSQGLSKEAEELTRKSIELRPNYAIAYSNLGSILRDMGRLKEAEISIRKAIDINPNYAIGYSNLGGILKDVGKLKEAELCILKAIELKPNYCKAYFILSTLKPKLDNQKWHNILFDKRFLNKRSNSELIDIYFARANILHMRKQYEESSKNLILANNLKNDLNRSTADIIIKKTLSLMKESENGVRLDSTAQESIFIVGMPRSGTTLVESIISMNGDVGDLEESNILEESFIEWKKDKQPKKDLNLSKLFWKKAQELKPNFRIITNKCLDNYQYSGIICKQIPNSKIIHCFRNPLDNILSIYRAHFAHGNEYSSSLADCSRVYINQEKIMREYKNKYRQNIYDLDYDLLVSKPDEKIRELISWLGWKWDEKYLSPHLNQRSVSTASNVQVRSPINSKSIGGWKNYQELMQPVISMIINNNEDQCSRILN